MTSQYMLLKVMENDFLEPVQKLRCLKVFYKRGFLPSNISKFFLTYYKSYFQLVMQLEINSNLKNVHVMFRYDFNIWRGIRE